MQKINFQNLPNTTTPVNATNLNAMQTNTENAINLISTYSTSETIVGKWINNKPIYRKVVYFNPSTTDLQTVYAHNISNIEEVLPSSCCLLHRTGDLFVPVSLTYPDDYIQNLTGFSCGWMIGKEYVYTFVGDFMRQQIDTTTYGVVTVLEYTKTTD